MQLFVHTIFFLHQPYKLRFIKNMFFFSSHVASVAAGNAGVPVVVNGFCYGKASGMAPRAR